MTDREIARNLRLARDYGELCKTWIRLRDLFRAKWAAEDSCRYINKIINSINWED